MDPNEYLGGRARSGYKGWPGLKLPGAKALFILDGVRERINITAAVVEGVTQIGYESLLGVLQMHPEHCPGLKFVTRHQEGVQPIVGASQPDRSLHLNTLDANQGFQSTSLGSITYYDAPWYLGGSCRITMSSDRTEPIGMAIWTDKRGRIEVSPRQVLSQGQSGYFSIGADIEEGEWAWLARWNDEGGSVHVDQTKAIGFAGGLW